MNSKALLQLGAELMFRYRHGVLPADREVNDYFRHKKFLGSRDRAFLGTVFFHVMRNLRRYDEAILSGFSQQKIALDSFTAGFPITSSLGARSWERTPGAPRRDERQNFTDRAIDTTRLGLAALELELMSAIEIGEELERCWPFDREKLPSGKERLPMKAATLTRLIEQIVDVARLYAKSKKPTEQERVYSFPSWLWGTIAVGRGIDELPELGEALNQQAPFSLRVNTLKKNRDEAMEALREKGIVPRVGDLAPDCIVLDGRLARSHMKGIEEGWLEIQDEGSQLVTIYTNAQPGQTVIDGCAGGGGKALHLGTLMQNRGTIYTMDIDPRRMIPLPQRAERGGITIINNTLVYGRDGSLPQEMPKADVVLIDVPCTGTGTLRRSPDIRWSLSQTRFSELVQTQAGILNQWAKIIPSGGLLVYATCSLLRAENGDQIARFLAEHPDFERDTTMQQWGERNGVLNKDGDLQIDPAQQGTDGFYAARLRKK